MDIFINGLEVYGHHGVSQEEKVLGQRLYFDIRLTLTDCKAAWTDRVEDTVDYTEVLDLVVDVATTRSYSLLERLAQLVAEAVLEKFPVDAVQVRVTKPHPPVACALSGVAASVELRRADL
ncbi:MAG: dihydroneopterin aldolase [Thermoleophilia bacterium]|nr:dihydroneopterin aldolase [Thermoleophilia bacterium]